MDWKTTYIKSEKAVDLAGKIGMLCDGNGWELVSVVHDGTLFHAFLKKRKSEA